jgi:hypothetical protein
MPLSLDAIRWLSLAGLAALAATPLRADACGGLFCASSNTPQPVDQSAERIIFEVFPEGLIRAHVQIAYAGAPDDFAWVVPVPSTPTVAESLVSLFAELDAETALVIRNPAADCDPSQVSGGGCIGCGAAADATSFAPAPRDGVTVYGQGETANYSYVVLGGTRSADVVGWLQDNRYNVSDNMIPAMEPYAARGKRFVALKLRPGATSSNITPVSLTYAGTEPEIPIQLTAVAAQPLMGIQVVILADRPFVPANYMQARPEPAEIHTDGLRTSYFDWVARRAAEAEGRLWVSESIIDTGPGRVLSRYYTRMSPEQMSLDPIFRPSPEVLLRQSRILDLSNRPAVRDCFAPIPDVAPGPCAFNFCGVGSRCVVGQDGLAGCICREGELAQRISGPDGFPRVTCVPRTNPLGVTDQAGGAGTPVDPCRQFDCGAGRCVLKGGFPLCTCPDGTFAATSGAGCVEASVDLPSFGAGAGPEAAVPAPGTRRTQLGAWSIPFALVVGYLAWTGRRAARRA